MNQFDELDEIEKHDDARIEECHEFKRWNKIRRDKERKSLLEEYWGDDYRKRIDDENNRNKPRRVSADFSRLI